MKSPVSPKWSPHLFPVIITVLLVVWTFIAAPHSEFGDSWATLPAWIAVTSVLIWHLALSVRFPGWRAAVAAAVHLAVLTPIFFLCIMSLSKDYL